MRVLSLIVLVALTWGMMATADVTLTNDFGGFPSPLSLSSPPGYTDFGSGLPNTPSIITVDPSAWSGAVTSLSISLLGLSYATPELLEVWVANPGGERSWLMGDAGGNYSVQGLDLTFEDGASSTMPYALPLPAGAYYPFAPFEPPPDAPGGPASGEISLAALINPGSGITGDWLLYVYSSGDWFDPQSTTGELGAWTLTFKGANVGGGGGGGGPGSTSGTPEPSALFLGLVAWAGLATRRPRRCW
jgi:hypothetical protein